MTMFGELGEGALGNSFDVSKDAEAVYRWAPLLQEVLSMRMSMYIT